MEREVGQRRAGEGLREMYEERNKILRKYLIRICLYIIIKCKISIPWDDTGRPYMTFGAFAEGW